MARTAPHRRSAKVIPKLSPAADGNSIHNEILLGLPRKECDAVFSDLELVEMRTHDQLNEMGEPSAAQMLTTGKRLNRYSQELGMQAMQVAACNRLHEVPERLARWLLMSQDRIGGDRVPLTQEFLAHMLGTRRASVTVGAGILQKAGLITYTRGAVTIVNRRNLEDAACECYQVITRQSRNWRNESS
jgi:hypothetical protein